MSATTASHVITSVLTLLAALSVVVKLDTQWMATSALVSEQFTVHN